MGSTQTDTQTSWWSTSSWFHGGLHEAQAAHPAVAPQAALPAAAPAALPADSLVAVGGAKAQSRFSGKTAIPIATCTPMSSGSGTAAAAAAARPAAATAASSQQQQPLQPPLPPPPPQQQATPLQLKQPTAALAAAAAARHAAMAGGRTAPVGRTVDGSVPRQAEGPITGEHVSRWVFDTRSWRWVVRGEPEAAPAVSDKHLLAARRWGDGRDALGAAATAASATAAAAEQAAAAAAAPGRAAAPAKRQRLQVGAMTGDASDEGFAAVGGLSRQKDALLQQVALPLAHPRLFARLGIPGARGVLLHGPPGSGKTHLARALAAEARLPIVALSGGECAGEQAERLLRSAFQRAKAQAPCLLLLDELDALAPARGASHSEHERQATARLLAAVDELRASRARVALVGATNRREAVDPALRRAGRLDCEVALSALHADERAEVLRCCTRRMPLARCVDLDAVAGRLRGYVAADVAAVACEAALAAAVEAVRAAEEAGQPEAVESPGFLAGLRVTAAHFEAAAAAAGPSVLRGLTPDIPDVSFEDIGGLEEAKAALADLVELPLAHAPLLAAYGLPAPRGALLYGPPGCGKTLLAKAAARRCGANFLSVRGPELLQKWLGESEAAVRRLFETARQAAPCLVFFDEIDSVAARRGGGGGGAAAGDAAAARVLNQLLVELDGMADRSHVFFLAATNRPEALDPALTRPGRLDRLVRVPLPDAGARLAVLRSALRRCPLGADVDLAALAGAPTEGLSGADLAEACRRAGMAAIRELVAAEEAAAAAGGSGAAAPPVHPLQQHHLEAALAGLRRSVSTAEEARHAGIEAALQRGSLPAPEEGEEASAERRRRQAGALEHLVRSAAEGSVAALQQRVAQLEAALQAAGLEPPPATA